MPKENKSVIKLLKLVFTIIAVISIFAVFYNIGIYTDNSEADAFTELEQKL